MIKKTENRTGFGKNKLTGKKNGFYSVFFLQDFANTVVHIVYMWQNFAKESLIRNLRLEKIRIIFRIFGKTKNRKHSNRK